MSTTTPNMARAPFSTAAFAQLVRRLRHTNARYNQIARQCRTRIRPTYYAKRRAYWAGLRIDATKARACPEKYVSVKPPPVLDPSAPTSSPYTSTASDGGAYMRGSAVPRVVMRNQRSRDGRQRVLLRLPPLKLALDVDSPSESLFEMPVPGAPRLLPRQLPDDDSGVEELMLGSASDCSASSFVDVPDALLTPVDVRVCPGLCITIPPRPLKRKLHDDVDADSEPVEQPKRILTTLWNREKCQRR